VQEARAVIEVKDTARQARLGTANTGPSKEVLAGCAHLFFVWFGSSV
jgi:hypothetical protein